MTLHFNFKGRKGHIDINKEKKQRTTQAEHTENKNPRQQQRQIKIDKCAEKKHDNKPARANTGHASQENRCTDIACPFPENGHLLMILRI